MQLTTDLARDEPIYIADGDQLIPQRWAQGPWYGDSQHGGAVVGILARAIEQTPSLAEMRPTRLTVELFRQVRKRPTSIRTEIVREGKRIQVVRAVAVVDDVEVAMATGLRIRVDEDVIPKELGLDADQSDTPPPGPETGGPMPMMSALSPEAIEEARTRLDFFHCFDHSSVETADYPVRSTIWYRLRHPVVAGEDPSPFVRLAATSDMMMSGSHTLGFERFSSINPDLSITILKPPSTDWIAMSCRSRIDRAAITTTVGEVYDLSGYVATSTKSMIVPRR